MIWRLRLLTEDHGWKLVLVSGLVLIFGQIVLFGGAEATTGLLFAGLLAGWAALVSIALPGPVPLLSRPSLAIATIAATLLAIWVFLTLTPYFPAWTAPEWSLLGDKASGAITQDRSATARELVKLGALGALFYAGLAIGRQRRHARFLTRTLAAAVIAYALWSIVTFTLTPELLLGEAKRLHETRLTGSFISANTAGSLFGALSVFFIVLAAEEGFAQLRRTPEFGALIGQGPSFTFMLYAFAAVLCLGALFLTASRFAIASTALGLAAGAFLIALLSRVKLWMASLAGLIALAVAVLLPVLSNAGAVRRIWNVNEAAADRLGAFELFTRLALERPWQGHGMGTFRQVLAPSIEAGNLPMVWNLGAAHNLGVQWFLEGGAIGAGLAGVVLLAVLSALWPFPLERSPGRGRAIAALGFAIVILAHNLVDYSLQIPAVAAVLALVLGLGAATVVQGENKGEAA